MLTINVIRLPEQTTDHFARSHCYGAKTRPSSAWFGAGATATAHQRQRATRQAYADQSSLIGEQQRQADHARARRAGCDLEALVNQAQQQMTRTSPLHATTMDGV